MTGESDDYWVLKLDISNESRFSDDEFDQADHSYSNECSIQKDGRHENRELTEISSGGESTEIYRIPKHNSNTNTWFYDKDIVCSTKSRSIKDYGFFINAETQYSKSFRGENKVVGPSSVFYQLSTKENNAEDIDNAYQVGNNTPERPQTPDAMISDNFTFQPLLTSSPSNHSGGWSNPAFDQDFSMSECEEESSDRESLKLLLEETDEIDYYHQQHNNNLEFDVKLTVVEKHIETREILLGKELDLTSVLISLHDIRIRLDSRLSANLRSSSGENGRKFVILDTSSILLCQNAIEVLQNKIDLKLLVPEFASKEIQHLIEQDDLHIKVHAEEAAKFIENNFKEKFERPENKLVDFAGLTSRELIWELGKLFPTASILTCDKDILKMSGKDQILCADGNNILSVLANRKLIISKYNETKIEGNLLTIRELLRDLIEVILVSEMLKTYCQYWRKIIKVNTAEQRPFWNLTNVLKAMELHHEAVFMEYYPENGITLRQCLNQIRTMLDEDYSVKQKVKSLVPLTKELCCIVQQRGDLPRSQYFTLSLTEQAEETLKQLQKINCDMREEKQNISEEHTSANSSSSNRLDTELELKAIMPITFQDFCYTTELFREVDDDIESLNSPCTVKGSDFGSDSESKLVMDFLDEGAKSAVEVEEKKTLGSGRGAAKTLMIHVWHMAHVMIFGLFDEFDVFSALDDVQPTYTFLSKAEAKAVALDLYQIYSNIRLLFGKIMKNIKNKINNTQMVEEFLASLHSFKPRLDVRDPTDTWKDTPTATPEEMIDYLTTEDPEMLANVETQCSELLQELEGLKTKMGLN